MMDLTKREFKLLILAVVIIGGGSLFKWGLKPVLRNYQTVDKELAAQEREWAQKKRLLEESRRYKRNLEEARGEVEDLNSLVLEGNLNAAQLKGLDILTTQLENNGLRVENKSLRVEKKEEQSYELLYYDFALRGSLGSLTDFLKSLQQAKKLFVVEKMHLRKRARGQGLEIKLVFKAFSYQL